MNTKATEEFDLLSQGENTTEDMKWTLFCGIMELTPEEQKKLLAMWKGRWKE